MIALKLVRHIEKHAEELTKRLLTVIQGHPWTQTFAKRIPQEELHERAFEIYRHLSAWLVEKTEDEIRDKNIAVGERRAEQQVPLHEVIFALFLLKDLIRKEVKHAGVGDSAIELFQTSDLMERLNQFFEKSVYYMTVGYEQAFIAGKPGARGRDEKEQKEFKELRHLVLPWWP